MKPTTKVTLSTAAAAAVSVAVWALSLAGVDVPAGVQGSATTFLVFVAGYAATERANRPAGRHERKE